MTEARNPRAVRALTVPAKCSQGHELTPRTTNITTSGTTPTGWECLRCLRITLWKAHYHPLHPTEPNIPIPADALDESRFIRQNSARPVHGKVPVWTYRVNFESGQQYADTDPGADADACPNGHPPERVYRDGRNNKVCRDCKIEQARRSKARRSA